jgi:cytochrome c peroxidase
MKTRSALFGLIALVIIVVIVAVGYLVWPRPVWTADQIATLRGLWIGSLPPLPPDPSNKYADDPRAAEFGQKLFFDAGFSANGAVACATCHDPQKEFQDGLPLSNGVGTTNRRAMTIVGTAYSPWLFWDGRKDSQWAQALGPMESAVEHGGNRTMYAHRIAQRYRAEYEAVFGPLPDLATLPSSAGPVDDGQARAAWDGMTPHDRDAVSRLYANMGKAIAAYERKIMPGSSRFDAYVEAVFTRDVGRMQSALKPDEVAGLRIFIGKGNCTNCHNGPLFTNNDFHNTGVPAVPTLPEDTGRALGAKQVLADPFNCLGAYSDAKPGQCGELRFMKPEGEQLVRAFKPPSLRNVAERAPYMHAGQFTSLEQVLAHYNRAPASPAGHSELKPLNLSDTEIAQLIAFLKSLSGPLATTPELLKPPA